ncbi:hypothetical protein ACFW6F_10615 [Streptomyces sp. NPDC058746]|uniref:hypothetical protein n=1 Tax=Streptomyces sp. NPDC058746 TaxID=3346622 RepID=UPI0036B37D97
MVGYSNVRLADLLDRRADGREPAPDTVLAALFEGGVFVPVTDTGSVMWRSPCATHWFGGSASSPPSARCG